MMQLMQFWKESLKKFRLVGIETLTSAIPVHRLNKLSYKATGSWSLNWFVIHPGKMPMKWWIYEYMNLMFWNCGMKKQMQTRSSQLKVQLMQLRKESFKKFRLARIRSLTSAVPAQCCNQLTYKATRSWSLIGSWYNWERWSWNDEYMNLIYWNCRMKK